MSDELDERHGFIHAHCERCSNPRVWLTCDACEKSDRFVREDEQIVCHCGARYAHATCTCGAEVPLARLEWVHWKKGPAALSEWELDRTRLAGVLAAVAVGLAGVVWWLLG